MLASLRSLLVLSAPLVLSGCLVTQPPGLDDAVIQDLESVWSADRAARVICYEVERSAAERLLPDVAAVRSDVHEQLGLSPPRTEVLLYPLRGPQGREGEVVRETRCDLTHGPEGWRLRFRYPWSEEPAHRPTLLGTTAHEVAEATVLLQVTVLDPYLRWMHDGIAELIEHQVLRRTEPSAARLDLQRMVAFLEERLADGVEWADLTRWRQLASWVVRSHRFMGPGAANLSLDHLDRSVARVREALAQAPQPVVQTGLEELEAMLLRAQAMERRPWADGEARPDDPATRDYVFYTLAFAFWLEVEREQPETVRRYVQALGGHRESGDHVLSAHEALHLLRRAAGDDLPPLTRFPVRLALETLRAELQALGS